MAAFTVLAVDQTVVAVAQLRAAATPRCFEVCGRQNVKARTAEKPAWEVRMFSGDERTTPTPTTRRVTTP